MRITGIKENLCKCFKENVEFIFKKDYDITELLTDSRNHFNPDGVIFIAIDTSGGNDGHNFIEDLYKKGVRNFIVEKLPEGMSYYEGANFIKVPDSIKALSIIGNLHRINASEVVALAGSRGKTTLKEILFQILEPYFNISRSPRSYNSKIGVPLSLWNIPDETDIAIIEAGISKKGEMEPLSRIINPDSVIFTNIGDAHSSGFKSKEEKAREKTRLAFNPYVKQVIYPKDQELIDDALKNLNPEVRKISWSYVNPDAEIFYRLQKKENTENGNIIQYNFQGHEGKIEVNLHQSYDLENISSALAYLLVKSFPEEKIEQSFKRLRPISTRLNLSEGINGCSIVFDSYTSDLSSLLPAIDFISRRKTPSQHLTLIQSDLLHETGNLNEAYGRMASIVKATGINKFIGIGEQILNFRHLFPEDSLFYKNIDNFLKENPASGFKNEIILIKGSCQNDFRKIYEQLEAKKHETVLEVNLDAMLRNYNYFRSCVTADTGIIAMVKAFGYGLGSYEIAKTLQDAGASYLAVAVVDEGIDLRKKGITMPVMIMNPKSANNETLFANHLEPVIYSFSMLEEVLRDASRQKIKNYPVHIKLDTGMHRMGFEKGDIIELGRRLKDREEVKISSIFSHLATADCLDMDEFTIRQLERFEIFSTQLIKDIGYKTKRHILNSAGILRFPDFHYDYVRLGIGLYGANTLPENIERKLWPVASLRTIIICIREIGPEERVGYGRRGEVKHISRIATLPIGYADGLNRKFGNGNLRVMINGQSAPTIGNICMDATMIDVTGIECTEGDSVEIFGENIALQSLADTLDTIPYEILTSVSPRVKRIYFRE